MKLREPGIECPPIESLHHREDASVWKETFEITTLTPIYGGGVKAGEPDLLMPARASAIRGQLRFWWRLLKRHHPTSPLAGTPLFEAEREIWGGMAEPDKDHSSKVKVRVIVPDLQGTKELIKPCAEYERDQNNPQKFRTLPKFAPEAHAYALFCGQGQLSRDRRSIEKAPLEIICPPLTFRIVVECPTTLEQEVIETLRWWASFGGLGARTRRGLGSVNIERLLPVTRKEAAQYGCRLELKPAISDNIKAWHRAVDKLQTFRQGLGVGRNPGTPPRPGRSRWPEPESIRGITGVHRIKGDGTSFVPANPLRREFPRAAFGLPIIFHFQNENGDIQRDPGDCELKPVDHDRMGSPLILKCMAQAIDKFAPIALLLPGRHLRGLNLELRNSGTGGAIPTCRMT